MSRSGRFVGGPDASVARFTESVSFDRRLWEADILGSIAHASMLLKIGLLTRVECHDIIQGLEQIAQEITEGRFTWLENLEDVHMNIEAALTQRVPAGAKLHTGRSRNDQVALDLRLWLRGNLRHVAGELQDLQRALVTLATKNASVVIPGYTHLQRAQPVYFAHHLLAYVEMFQRDHERLRDCFYRLNVCPLGSGALAGSTLPLNREFVASLLGFIDKRGRPRVSQNSMDAVSDRDFAVEFCAAAALLGVHLSRMAEDIILWASAEFGFIQISDAYTTGSSLMPQKKNPDVAELTRGRASRLIGNLVSLLTLLKGLPMTYNRDLQEDKEQLFDTTDTIRQTLRVIAGMLEHTSVNQERCAQASADPALLATDLVDHLVQRGVPFRDAHHLVGRVVALAEAGRIPLNQLDSARLREIDPRLTEDALSVFDLKRALRGRQSTGAPGTAQVRRQLTRWAKQLAPPRGPKRKRTGAKPRG